MATADLSRAETIDEVALHWSRFLIEHTIEQREEGSSPLIPCVYTFKLSDGSPVLPQIPVSLGNPPTIESLLDALRLHGEHLYAYLVLMPGVPMGDSEARAYSLGNKPDIPIKVPNEIIEQRGLDMYLMGAFWSKTEKRVYCSTFDGERFGSVLDSENVATGGLVGALHFE